MILHFFVHEQTVTALETTSVPRFGSKGYLKLAFEFDESWDIFPAANGARTVYLQKGATSAPIVLDASGCVDVDDYFTATGDGFMLMLVGINGTVACPTNVLSISLEPSGEVWTAEPPDLDLPAYQQLVSLAQQAVEAAEEAKQRSYCLPVARGQSGDGAAYVATGENLPDVKPGSNGTHAGKGKQIIFIPEYPKNKSESPALQINGGDLIPIRMRAPKNQLGNEQSPYATLPVPVGALMVGVPYTMTFCGLYWLVDSTIAQYACADDAAQAELLRESARKLVLLSENDTIGMPIINSADGVGTAKARIKRSAEEDASPDVSGNVTLPTEARVKELTAPCIVNMTKNADGTYTADKTFAALKAAHDAGQTVICSFRDLTRQWDGPVRLPLVYLGNTYMGFAAVVDQEQGNMVYLWAYINSGGMGHTATEIATEEMTEAYVVNMTKNADGTYTADKTFADLKAAHDAGRTVICSFNDLTQQWDTPFRLPVVCAWSGGLGFAGVIEPEQNYQIFAQVYISSGGMGYTATELRGIPKPAAADNNKVLTTVDGSPVWTDISPCVVNMAKNADGTYTADKKFAELKAAHDAGKTVICSFQDLTQQWDGPVRLPVVDTTDVHMGFAGVIEPRQNHKIFAYVYINSSDMGYTATEIAAKDTVSAMIAAAIGDTATALSDLDSVIGGAGA